MSSAHSPRDTWRTTRLRVLADNPRCDICGQGLATQVDHVRPRHLGGTDARANLRALCASCHRRKSALELVAAAVRRGGGDDGDVVRRILRWNGIQKFDVAANQCEKSIGGVRCGGAALYVYVKPMRGGTQRELLDAAQRGTSERVIECLLRAPGWTVRCSEHRPPSLTPAWSWEDAVRSALGPRWQNVRQIQTRIAGQAAVLAELPLSREARIARRQIRLMLDHLADTGDAETGPTQRPGKRAVRPYLWRATTRRAESENSAMSA